MLITTEKTATLLAIALSLLAIAHAIRKQPSPDDLLSSNVEALSLNEEDGFEYREKFITASKATTATQHTKPGSIAGAEDRCAVNKNRMQQSETFHLLHRILHTA